MCLGEPLWNVFIWEPREGSEEEAAPPGGADGGNNSPEGKYKHGRDYGGGWGGFVLIPGRLGMFLCISQETWR